MSKIHTIGIIGAGMIAEAHIQNLQKTERASIKWLADINTEILKEVSVKYSITNTTYYYKDILNDKEVDAVIICTPPWLHYEMFMEALAAEKHILIEKPAAMSMTQIDNMISKSRQYPHIKVLDCSARHSRLQPKFGKIKEIIDSGVLGTIYYMHHNCLWRNARAGIEYHPKAKWFLNKKIAGGGPLFDWGVYDLSFHLGILGDQVGVENVNMVNLKSGLDKVDPGTNVYNVEEHFMVNLQLSNDIDFYWERAMHANMESPNETRIYGTQGGLKLGYCSWDEPTIEFFDAENEGKGKGRKQTFEVDMKDHDDSYALSEHFVKVLEDEEEPAMPLSLARKHLDIIFRCYNKAGVIS